MNRQPTGNSETDTPVPAGDLRRALEFKERTLPRILQTQAPLADKVLARTTGHQITYAEAPVVAARVAGLLVEAGLQPGDRVVAMLSNRIELIELWFGVSWAGAHLVPLNTAFRGSQLDHVIRTSKPTVIVVEADLLPHLQAIAEAVAGATTVFLVDSGSDLQDWTIGGMAIQPLTRDAKPIPPHAVSPADPAAILFTSGTTGPSKGVICPHAQFYWWGILTSESLRITSDDVIFTALPLFHTNALNALWQAILAGGTYAFVPRFSASRFWKQARENHATVTYLLGAIVQILLNQPPSGVDRDHYIRVALSPATPVELTDQFQNRFGVTLISGYGSTETNFVLSNAIGKNEPGTMGRVQEGFEVRIVDENDCDVPDGEAGEMVIRNHEPFSMASGYFSDAGTTVRSWRNLWFHTGDRVVRNTNGVYQFVDRIADAIRRRGENISSWEVENALMLHPDISNAAVIGVASEMTEEEVMAFVEIRADCQPDPGEIIRFLESRLAYFAIPRYWEFVSKFPMTENGKVKKHRLRERGITSTTWDREEAGVLLNRGVTT